LDSDVIDHGNIRLLALLQRIVGRFKGAITNGLTINDTSMDLDFHDQGFGPAF
jgi:hypothetical protein